MQKSRLDGAGKQDQSQMKFRFPGGTATPVGMISTLPLQSLQSSKTVWIRKGMGNQSVPPFQPFSRFCRELDTQEAVAFFPSSIRRYYLCARIRAACDSKNHLCLELQVQKVYCSRIFVPGKLALTWKDFSKLASESPFFRSPPCS